MVNFRVTTLFKLYLTVTVFTITSLKSIEQFQHAQLAIKAISNGRTDRPTKDEENLCIKEGYSQYIQFT